LIHRSSGPNPSACAQRARGSTGVGQLPKLIGGTAELNI